MRYLCRVTQVCFQIYLVICQKICNKVNKFENDVSMLPMHVMLSQIYSKFSSNGPKRNQFCIKPELKIDQLEIMHSIQFHHRFVQNHKRFSGLWLVCKFLEICWAPSLQWQFKNQSEWFLASSTNNPLRYSTWSNH